MSQSTVQSGQFVSWDGGCMFIGSFTGVVPVHAHYAIQLAFGAEPVIRFRGDDDEPWMEFDGAIIASRQPHSMDTTRLASPGNAVIFVEPETREGRVLAERYLSEGIAALPAEAMSVARELMSLWVSNPSIAGIRQGAWRLIETLTGRSEPAVVSDERILRAIAYVNARLGEEITLHHVASEANLSPGRFRHLFVEQTGLGLRPYILWRRFIRVWDLLKEGESLSGAAHRAGFADAAHLTRTARRMFGTPPSAMGALVKVPSEPGGAPGGGARSARYREQDL